MEIQKIDKYQKPRQDVVIEILNNDLQIFYTDINRLIAQYDSVVLFLKTLNGDTQTFSYRNTLGELKSDIEKKLNIRFYPQLYLKYNDTYLVDNKASLHDLKVQGETTLQLCRLSDLPDLIFIKNVVTGRYMNILVNFNDTIEIVKKKIAENRNNYTIPLEYNLEFSIWGILENDRTLKSFGIQKGHILQLTPFNRLKNGSFFEIRIRIFDDGEAFTLDVEGNYTVQYLKKLIEEEIDCHVSRQRIIFAGKALEDDRTLSDYNLQQDCTLYLLCKS